MNSDLRDRLFARMVESARAWTAEEIAREVLKIVSDAVRADSLVAAILGRDARFVRQASSTWTVRIHPAPSLQDLPFLLADVPVSPNGVGPLVFQRYDPDRRRLGEALTVSQSGAGLRHLVAALDGRLPASVSASTVRRRLHEIERGHAIAARSERVLDLSACAKLLGLALPAPVARGSTSTVEERMIACRDLLDEILGEVGSSTLDEVEARIEDHSGARQIDFSRFRFGREELSRIPPRPGLYRFHGDADSLLYVGKSRDLRRRIGSYFRPLAPDHERRASLLDAIRDLSWQTTPSELEALLLEFEAIRSERPVFNQQVDVHSPPMEGRAGDADLGFVLCEGDPDEVSVFLFRDRVPWARGRLPRSPAEVVQTAARAMTAAWEGGLIAPDSGLVPFDDAGRGLVLRYLALHRDRVDRLGREGPGGSEAIAHSLAALASRERPSWDPWSLRGA